MVISDDWIIEATPIKIEDEEKYHYKPAYDRQDDLAAIRCHIINDHKWMVYDDEYYICEYDCGYFMAIPLISRWYKYIEDLPDEVVLNIHHVNGEK